MSVSCNCAQSNATISPLLPTALQPIPNDIPAELRERRQWVAWRYQFAPDRNKPCKKPICSATGLEASTTDPATWGTMSAAMERCRQDELDGIGFVFSENDPFCGIDLDHCRDPKTGEIAPGAREIISKLGSYSEVSPSETGIKVIVKGKLPPTGRKCGNIEMYDKARYFALTGRRVQGTPAVIHDRQKVLNSLHASAFGQRHSKDQTRAKPHEHLGDDEKFALLWAGQWQGLYPSHSESDLAFCRLLFQMVGPNRDAIDRLFRASGLMRTKWDEVHYADNRTYGQGTIDQVLKPKVADARTLIPAPPCPRQFTVLQNHTENTSRRRVLDLRCRSWKCHACAIWLRNTWQQNICSHLASLPAGAAIYRFCVPLDFWRTRQRAIQRQDGSYVAVAGLDKLTVWTTVQLPGATTLTRSKAETEILAAIQAVPVGASRPIRTSTDWKLSKRKKQADAWKLLRRTRAASARSIAKKVQQAGIKCTMRECRGGVEAITEYAYPANMLNTEQADLILAKGNNITDYASREVAATG
jgi:putative DNA primase/helicase